MTLESLVVVLLTSRDLVEALGHTIKDAFDAIKPLIAICHVDTLVLDYHWRRRDTPALGMTESSPRDAMAPRRREASEIAEAIRAKWQATRSTAPALSHRDPRTNIWKKLMAPPGWPKPRVEIMLGAQFGWALMSRNGFGPIRRLDFG